MGIIETLGVGQGCSRHLIPDDRCLSCASIETQRSAYSARNAAQDAAYTAEATAQQLASQNAELARELRRRDALHAEEREEHREEMAELREMLAIQNWRMTKGPAAVERLEESLRGLQLATRPAVDQWHELWAVRRVDCAGTLESVAAAEVGHEEPVRATSAAFDAHRAARTAATTPVVHSTQLPPGERRIRALRGWCYGLGALGIVGGVLAFISLFFGVSVWWPVGSIVGGVALVFIASKLPYGATYLELADVDRKERVQAYDTERERLKIEKEAALTAANATTSRLLVTVGELQSLGFKVDMALRDDHKEWGDLGWEREGTFVLGDGMPSLYADVTLDNLEEVADCIDTAEEERPSPNELPELYRPVMAVIPDGWPGEAVTIHSRAHRASEGLQLPEYPRG